MAAEHATERREPENLRPKKRKPGQFGAGPACSGLAADTRSMPPGFAPGRVESQCAGSKRLPPIVAGAALSTLPVKVGTGYCRLDARNEAGHFSLGIQNPLFKYFLQISKLFLQLNLV
jgi:hypothetical protein